jgi:hypothetical protein
MSPKKPFVPCFVANSKKTKRRGKEGQKNIFFLWRLNNVSSLSKASNKGQL